MIPADHNFIFKMDPIAHTLFGATLSEAGLRRKTALATATLVVGANLPDIDALAMFVSSDFALLVRRGWTHGILALMIWPFLLTGVMLAIDKFIRRNKSEADREGPPLHPGWLLAIAFIGVWSHPLLDWLNTYGVRMLMPFSETWFYGDTLFIVDPWFWLLTGAGVVLARSKTRWGMAGWITLGTALTALVITAEIPLAAKLVWGGGIAAIGWMRATGQPERFRKPLALYLLTALLLYTMMMFIGSRATADHARDALTTEGVTITDVMANPLPARPLLRTGIAASDTHYYRFRVNWMRPASFELMGDPIPIETSHRAIQSAMQSPDIQGMLNWIRFPHFEATELDDGWQVIIRDLRYVHPDQLEAEGIGMDVVELDRNFEIIR
jgi:inner membrane protein